MFKPGEAEPLPPGRGKLDTRGGRTADAESIVALQDRELERGLVLERVEGLLQDFPSVMLDEDGGLAGFVYSIELVPDILQVANLLIARRLQGTGLGTRILSELERSASSRYAAIVAVNSSLYGARGGKSDARSFYAAAGYELVYETPSSRMFAKALGTS